MPSSSSEPFLPPSSAAVWQSGVSTPLPAGPTGLVRVAGALLLMSSIGFLTVFAWLAAHFGYPDVLDRPARDVLPALRALGETGRAVWAVYAVLPLLLVPAVALAAPALERDAPDRSLMATARGLQVVASLAMTIGLARWSTLQWTLAEALSQATPDRAAAITSVSDAMNGFLGNALGEFVGELALYGVFAAFTMLLWRRGARALAALGAVTTVAGWIGMVRNITPTVNAIATLSNVLLPLFLIVLGARLLWRGDVSGPPHERAAR